MRVQFWERYITARLGHRGKANRRCNFLRSQSNIIQEEWRAGGSTTDRRPGHSPSGLLGIKTPTHEYPCNCELVLMHQPQSSTAAQPPGGLSWDSDVV